MLVPALSVSHYRPFSNGRRSSDQVVEAMSASDPARLAEFRREFDALVAEYFRDNLVRQDYLLTRATKL